MTKQKLCWVIVSEDWLTRTCVPIQQPDGSIIVPRDDFTEDELERTLEHPSWETEPEGHEKPKDELKKFAIPKLSKFLEEPKC